MLPGTEKVKKKIAIKIKYPAIMLLNAKNSNCKIQTVILNITHEHHQSNADRQ